MTKGSSSGGGGGRSRRGGKRGVLFLVSTLLIVQLISWRGTLRLKAVSLSKSGGGNTQLYKRQLLENTAESIYVIQSNTDLMNDLNKKKSSKKHEKDKKKSSKKHEKDEKKKKKKEDKQHSTTSSSSKTSSQSSTISSSTSSASSTTIPIIECHPLPTVESPQDVCQHVREYCPPTGHLNYLEFFFCIGLSDNATSQIAKAQATAAPLPWSEPSEQEPSSDIAEEAKQEGLTTRLKWLRALALASIIAWMLFLFSWVGIVASDFFCPNLSNLAAKLGLSESTAGVTFLAFGNGSPDVFSTFGAMRTGSGSLAIGELIGAASFIVSVISGSMMLIAPFRVKPYPFIRDVGFFTVAVSLTMTYLIDGRLRFSECLSMIALYLVYAATIIIGSWLQNRRRERRVRMASIRSENSFVDQSNEAFRDELERQTPSTNSHRSPRIAPFSAIEYQPDVDPFVQWAIQQDSINSGGGHLTPPSNLSTGHSPSLQPVDLPTGSSSISNSNAHSRLLRFKAGVLARHSLLGAVEFRDVVRSLRQESGTDRSIEIYQSRDPERYLPHPHSQIHTHHMSLDEDHGHKHKRAKSLTKPRLSATSAEFQASLVRSRSTIGSSADRGPLADIVRPNLEQVGQESGLAAVAAALGDPWKEHGPADGCEGSKVPTSSTSQTEQTNEDDEEASTSADLPHRPILPRLAIRQATGPSRNIQTVRKTGDRNDARQYYESPFSSKEAFIRALNRTRRALFPSLRHFREKSWLGVAIGLVTAPAILLLKITLPVVDDETEQAMMSGEKQFQNGNSSGQIRLAGDESPLLARQRPALDTGDATTHFEEEEEEDDETVGGRGVIDLSATSMDNPWDVSRTQSQDDEGNESEEANRKRQLHVSSGLRNLPEEASPLLFSSPSPLTFSAGRRNHFQRQDSAVVSLSDSEDSWQSDDSHIPSPTQNLFLTVAQCAFAPPFCVWAISSSAESKHVFAKTIFAFLCGLGISTIVFLTAMHYRHNERQSVPYPALIALSGWTRVAIGFFVSILYIMTIVDEVVSILQTLGLILGLSDAILGLTVFAMGNSLGDLVANITIAKMGHPVMAISACFAGPLLNLLLGIGISGSWLLSQGAKTIPDHPNNDQGLMNLFSGQHSRIEEPGVYLIDFSPTLTVSGFGLLLILIGTLILVPLNGFYLDRRIGSTLIITYIIIMCVNIGVELYSIHGTV